MVSNHYRRGFKMIDSPTPGSPTFVLAPDSFKESMTAHEVCQAMKEGLREAFPGARFLLVPMADGGEGTMRSLVDARGGSVYEASASDPLGRSIVAHFGLFDDGRTAVIEMASASGLERLDPSERDPRVTTTRGTGDLLLAALNEGATHIIIAIGGSATNDGGAGFAQALGARLLDADGHDLPPGGAALAQLARIDVSGLDPRLASVSIQVACDVDNPLCGVEGASAVYGPQKGADASTVVELDAALAHYAEIVHRDLGRDVAAIPGAGAAGGLGAGLLAFTGARLRRGVQIVIDETGLAEAIAQADLVLTGEGRVDEQTRRGKTPFGVAAVARAAGKPVIAIAGCVGEGADLLTGDVFDALFPIIGRVGTLEQVLADGPANVRRTCRNLGHALRLSSAFH